MFLDSDLKKIIALLPAQSVLMVNKTDLMKSGFKVVAQLRDTAAHAREVQQLAGELRLDGVAVLSELPGNNSLADAADFSLEAPVGFHILQIYFFALLRAKAAHLDLRGRYFSLTAERTLGWHPSALRYRFGKKFSAGVRDLYDGFYFAEPAQFRRGLADIGLLPARLGATAQDEIVATFGEHFGQGRAAPIRFSVSKLRESFEQIFAVLKRHEVKIDSDFAFLGAMLSTMYTTLEKIAAPIDVRAAYLSVRDAP